MLALMLHQPHCSMHDGSRSPDPFAPRLYLVNVLLFTALLTRPIIFLVRLSSIKLFGLLVILCFWLLLDIYKRFQRDEDLAPQRGSRR